MLAAKGGNHEASNTKEQGQQAAKKRNRTRHARAGHVAPRTARRFFKMSKETRSQWVDVVSAVSQMRTHRKSLAQAAIEVGIDPRTVERLGKSALRKRKNGTYIAKRSDTLLRILTIPAADGLREIVTRDSREASKLGKYGNAVRVYLGTEQTALLERFSRKMENDHGCQRQENRVAVRYRRAGSA